MLNSKDKEQIDKAIIIINNLNDNEKDLVITDINKKIKPFNNDGTLNKKNITKEATINNLEIIKNANCSDRISICPLCGKSNFVKKGKNNKGKSTVLL